MPVLILAALVWLGLHIGIAGSALRRPLAARLGDNGFRGVFSLLSVACIVWLIVAYNHAPGFPLWTVPAWLGWVLVLIMLPAFVLFLGGFTPSPTGMGPFRTPRAVQRITRHPLLWSVAIWAAVHMVARGSVAGVVFFGTFLLTALAGMPSIDAKAAARDPAGWAQFAAATSIVPFARGTAGLAGIGWKLPLLAVIIWLAVLFLHRPVIGLSPLPG